jgi:glycosyltransferase involved in cell wall biosynthesis
VRVALDVTPMTTGLTGVARYARELHDGLLRNGVDVVPVAFGRGPHQPPPGTRRYGVPLRLVQRSWQLTGRPRVEDLVGSVDISHCVDLLPVPTAGRLVMTAHDVVAVEHPELHAPRQVQQQVRQLSAYARADAVLANSRTTAAALARHGVPPGLITVTSLGVTPPKAVTPAPAGRFVLAVGELTARKNLATLVEGFQRAALPDDVRLLVVGPDGRAGHAVQLPDDPRVVR